MAMAPYTDRNGFEISGDTLIGYHGQDAVIRVPEGVVHVGEGAFTRPVLVSGGPGEPPPMMSWDGRDNPELDRHTHTEHGGYEFIREVCLPESVKTIGPHAFESCINLERVHLPDGLQSIGERAFTRCYKLDEIEIPRGTNVHRRAFFMTCIRITRKP